MIPSTEHGEVAAPAPIRTKDEIGQAWLSAVLKRPGLTITNVEEIGTGQMSQCYRVTLDDEDTVVVKLASEDPTSRATGQGMGAYAQGDLVLPGARRTDRAWVAEMLVRGDRRRWLVHARA